MKKPVNTTGFFVPIRLVVITCGEGIVVCAPNRRQKKASNHAGFEVFGTAQDASAAISASWAIKDTNAFC